MMRHFFFLALTLLGLGSLRADDSDERFFALGEECRWKDGGVRIDLYPDASCGSTARARPPTRTTRGWI